MRKTRIFLAAAALLGTAAHAQDPAWQSCAAITDGPQRLACFDRWAAGQQPAPAAPASPPAVAPTPPLPQGEAILKQPNLLGLRFTEKEGCHETRYSELSRFWELEPGADCGTFGLRVFHPISADVATGGEINRLPSSGNPANNATTSIDYHRTEVRLQVSVRTKIAQGLFTHDESGSRDSLWFGYTQQSYWQLFTPALSRPFRSTDHEPELLYILPLQPADPDRWRVRFGGVGIVHQSNGQSLPLSRSWNRVYLMAGAEHGRLQLQGRIWQRLHESDASDDNPHISDFIGRGEARVVWHHDRRNLFSATLRHALRSEPRGSLRLEWFRTLSQGGEGPVGGLQLHTQLFSGYGDTLLDFNRRRTVFSIGLSLVDW